MIHWLLIQFAILFHLVSPAFQVSSSSPVVSSAAPINYGTRDKKVVALTFDACMTYGMEKKLKNGKAKSYYNKPIIDELIKENVPATLFLTGLWAKNYPDVTKSLSSNPLFEIGNHSYSHPAFTPFCYGLPKIRNREDEFRNSQEILKSLIGDYPKLFRFPGGCYSKSDLDLAKKYGLTVIGWDVASGDDFNKNSESIIKKVERKVGQGSIIVMHMNGDIDAPVTHKALPEIIKYLKVNGYTFVKVSDMIK